jgi:hypothetical protein
MYTNKRTVTLDGVVYIDLLYMVLYPYNDGPMVFGIGVEIGDLEHVRILVNAGTERIDRVYLRTQWRILEKHRRMSRRRGSVQVYSARGTHANYQPRYAMEDTLVLKDVTSDEGVAGNRPSSYKHRY